VEKRACTGKDVRATATVRTDPTGTFGVVHLTGQGCSLHVVRWPTTLTGHDGEDLKLKTPGARNARILGDARPDLAEAAGDVDWGFGIAGSWCGEPAASVTLRIGSSDTSADATPLSVPLPGATLRCTGHNDAEFLAGSVGGSVARRRGITRSATPCCPPRPTSRSCGRP
jgi:hypothetical protein